MGIFDVYDFDARRAAMEFLAFGFVVVDDIGENLYDLAREELLDELGHAADDFEVHTDRMNSSLGPVFVFRDRKRATPKQVRAFIAACRPEL